MCANTASFSGDLGKAANEAEKFGKSAKDAGDTVDFSMREARGSMMLMGEELGIRVPREIRTLIAEIPGIGLAFEALLPVMGVVFAAKMIYDFVEKTKAASEALSKGFATAAHSTAEKVDELRVSIAETKLRIDSLLGNPTKSDALVAEIARAVVEADKLSDSLKKDLEDFIKLLEGAAHGKLMTALLGTSGSGQAVDVAKGLADALAKIPHDSHFAENYKQSVVDAWQRAQSEIDKNKETNTKQAYADQSGSAGGSHMTDFTKANQALQEFQQRLSATYNELDLIGKNDAGKKQEKDLKDAAAAAVEAEKEYKKQQEGLQRYLTIHREYLAKKEAETKKAAEQTERIAEEEAKATSEYQKAMREQWVAEQATTLSNYLAQLSQQNEATKQQHDLGLISEREYAQKMMKVYAEEYDAKRRFAEMEIKQQDDPNKKLQLQKQLNRETEQYVAEITKLGTALQKTEASWKTYFGKMKVETQDLSTQIRTNLQGSVTQFTKSFGDSMAKCIVENKSLGQAVKQEAGQMLESMISMLVQWLEKWILTHTLAKVFQTTTDEEGKLSAAELAGANMVASWSAAPWPIDGAAPAMGAAAFAAALAFENGGTVPGTGTGDTVPAMLSPGETVVSKALTDQVKGNTTNNVSGHHITYAPQINAVDANGVESMLKKHAAVFQKHVTASLRKANKRG